MGRTRCFWSTLILLSLSLLAAAAPGLAEAPRLVRAEEPHALHGGVLLLHAGGERPTSVRIYGIGPDGAVPTDQVFRSSYGWTAHPYVLPEGTDRAEARPAGPVWIATGVHREATEDEVSLDCAAVGSFVFWRIETEEVRLERDKVEAPQVRVFTPRSGPLVPDEPAVRDHVLFLEPDGAPLYLEVARRDPDCAGVLTLHAGDPPGASPFAGAAREVVLAAIVIGAVLAVVLVVVGVVGWRRDQDRPAMAPPWGVLLLYGRRVPGPHMRPFIVLLLAVLLLPAVGASEWGIHEVDAEDEVRPPAGSQGLFVCVAAPASGGEVVLHQEQEAGTVAHAFHPTADAADCRSLPAGTLVADGATSGAVRVLVLAKEPREATAPGVVRLAAPGVALAVDRLSTAAEIGILPDGSDVVVAVLRADTLETVRTVTPPGETRVAVQQADAEAGLIVALIMAPDGGSALVDWEDPDWFRATPTIGQIAVVVAVALFLVFYHGRSPRRLG